MASISIAEPLVRTCEPDPLRLDMAVYAGDWMNVDAGSESIDADAGLDVACCFCGYEPMDPGGIYSELFETQVCADCEQLALRVLTTAAEAGEFRIGTAQFEVRAKKTK